jgi:TolA-binding protein
MKLSIDNRAARVVAFAHTTMLAGAAAAAADADQLQPRLAQMEREVAVLRAKPEIMRQAEPQHSSRVSEFEIRAAKVEQGGGKSAAKGHRVFFRGGYPSLVDDRANTAFTDMMDVPGALGLGSVKHRHDDGPNVGAGFDFLLSKDTLKSCPLPQRWPSWNSSSATSGARTLTSSAPAPRVCC